jgi:hypothetical protein
MSKKYPTLTKWQSKNLAASASQTATAASSYPPIFEDFTSKTEVTINHSFPSKHVTVIVYSTAGIVFLPGKFKAVVCSDTSVRIAFNGTESGTVKLTY